MLDTKGSLETFIRCCYDLTGLETDMEFITDLVDAYETFCHTFRVSTEVINN